MLRSPWFLIGAASLLVSGMEEQMMCSNANPFYQLKPLTRIFGAQASGLNLATVDLSNELFVNHLKRFGQAPGLAVSKPRIDGKSTGGNLREAWNGREYVLQAPEITPFRYFPS